MFQKRSGSRKTDTKKCIALPHVQKNTVEWGKLRQKHHKPLASKKHIMP